MKVIVTGASGIVGRQLVPLLTDGGADLLLVGRSREMLKRRYPQSKSCTYATLAQDAVGYDLLVHLAVLNNNNTTATDAQFHEVNTRLLIDTIKDAKNAGVKSVVNVSSFHALGGSRGSSYARSKRNALEAIKRIDGIKITTLFLPPVYGDRFSGKLALLNRLPKTFAMPVFHFLCAITPTVDVMRIVQWVAMHAQKLDDTDTVGVPYEVFLSDRQQGHHVYTIGKWLIDMLFALLVIGLFWWVLAIVWVLVKRSSAGPGIFAQKRIGRGGNVFTCYKFRTMQQDTVQAGTHEVPAHSVTSIGKFLRRTKIDELPQVWNILRGEVSLIGPRPGLPIQTKLTAAREARNVYDVLPGISGLAQIHGIDMSEPVKLARWDALYIARRSLILDIKLILKTAFGAGQGDKTL